MAIISINVKGVIQNSASLAAGQLIVRAIGFLVSLVLIRRLGSVQLGKYSFVLGYVYLFGFVADLGLNQLVIRDVSRDRSIAARYLGNVLQMKLALNALMCVLLVVLLHLLDYPPPIKHATYAAAAGLVFESLSSPFSSIIMGFEKMHFNALVNIVASLINSALVLAVIFFQKDILALILVYVVNNAFSLAALSWLCTRQCAKPEWKRDFGLWGYLLKSTIPFAIVMGCGVVYYKVDIVMLSVMKGDAVVGWYSAAYRLIDVLQIVAIAASGAMSPLLARQFATEREALRHTMNIYLKYLGAYGLAIAGVTSLLADKIIGVLFGAEFHNSIIALRILVWFVALASVSGTLSTLLMMANRAGDVAFGYAVNALGVVGLNLLLIPRYSYIGTSWTTVLSGMVSLLIFGECVRRHVCRLTILTELRSALMASVVMYSFVYLMRGSHLFFVVGLASLLYVALLAMFGFFGPEDRRFWRAAFRMSSWKCGGAQDSTRNGDGNEGVAS